MHIWFCQTCGAQVTENELGHLPGLNAKSLVYCKDCEQKERRVERMSAAAAKPIRHSPKQGFAPSERASPRSGAPAPLRNSPRQGTEAPKRGSGESPKRGSGSTMKRGSSATINPPLKRDSGPEIRRGSGAAPRRPSGPLRTAERDAEDEPEVDVDDGNEPAPRANRKFIMVAGIIGWFLLLAGVFIFVVGMPDSKKGGEPPRPNKQAGADTPNDKMSTQTPQKQPDPEPQKPAEDPRDLENRAKKAFAALEEKLQDSKLSNDEQQALLDAFLKDFKDSIIAARARTMRDKLKPPAPVEPAKPDESPQEKQKKMVEAMKADPVNKHVLNGNELLQKKDLAGALAEYERALLLDPHNASIYRGRAWVKSLQGRYEESMADITKAVECSPNDYFSLALQSILAHALGNKELAQKARDAALSKVDDNSRVAWATWISNESGRGFALYHGRPFEKKPPQTALDWMYRGMSRQVEERVKEAEQDFREAIKRGGDNPDLTYAYVGLSQILEQREDYKGKMEFLEHWLKIQPDSVTILCNMSWELLNCKDASLRDPKRALPMAQRASDLSKHKDAGIEDTLALALFNDGQAGKAYEVQKRAIEMLPKEMLPDERELYVQHLSQYELAKPPDP